MEPIKGTNVSLALAQIATQHLEYADKLETAQAKLVLDTMRQAGAQAVELIEGLGKNIDLYA